MDLPKMFTDRLREDARLPGGECLERLAEALAETEPSVAVRLNRRFDTVVTNPQLRPIPWAGRGYWLGGVRPRFTFDPSLHQGVYYIQDPSSMAIGAVIGLLLPLLPDAPVYVDACAAPGGKTTAAIDALPPDALVVANEFDHRRAEVLAENIVKWGATNTVVSRGDTSRLAAIGSFADIVAVDAPCSGEGMMRKDDTAVTQWSAGLVAQCAALQRQIIDNMWEALRPGGFMIYSTCTFNRDENEENLRYLVEELGAEPFETHLSGLHGIAGGIGTPYPCLRFIPGRVDGEGIFMAVVRKPADAHQSKPRRQKHPVTPVTQVTAQIRKGLASQLPALSDKDASLVSYGKDSSIAAIPAAHAATVARLFDYLDILTAGVTLATLKGRDLVPAHHAALVMPETFATVELGYADAVAYLSGEALTLPDGTPRGYVCVTYGGNPLGLVKNLGNRANNMYPRQWVIRSGHRPAEAPVIL